jgi:TonB family protein
MKKLFITLVVLGSISSFAQSGRQYLDENKKLLLVPEGASYYRETNKKGNLYVVKDFYTLSEQLAMEATCSEIEPRLVYDGPHKTYHKNGKPMEDGAYNDNRNIGLWFTYYENGQPEEEVQYEKDKSLHQQHWDESGTAHLVNGTGFYTEKNPNRGEQHVEVLDYVLIASYAINPVSDTTYVVVQETATYNGGMPELYETIGKSLRYPAEARKRGIEGKVFVEFLIDKGGRIRDVKAIKGPDRILNEEAERVMRMMDDWTPGKVRGKPVVQRMVLPLAFRLG